MIQEQHAERCRLYAQWKQLDWPILQDQMTSFGLAVVPVAVLIDEYGIVQSTRFRNADIEKLVAEKREPPSERAPILDDRWATAASVKANFDWSTASAQEAVWFGDVSLKSKQLDDALKAYEFALKKARNSNDEDVGKLVPEINFRIGVVMRASRMETSDVKNWW